MDISKLCPGCMMQGMTEQGRCSLCGYAGEDINVSEGLAQGNILNGKYVIGKVIGQGGFGITYIGFDLSLQMRVAIKELYPKKDVHRDFSGNVICNQSHFNHEFEHMKAQFLEEARVIALFDSNNGIVSVREFFTANSTAYIVMEYLSGDTIKHIVKENGPIDTDIALELFKPIIKAMANLHDEKMLHRDISPDNIIVTKRQGAKLIDFGTVKTKDSFDEAIYVKKGYSPPEQYEGKDAGTYTDVYAFCATLYYVLTGVVPESGIERKKQDKLVHISCLVSDLNEVEAGVIMQGLALKPEQRIKSARELYYYLYVYARDNDASSDKLYTMLHSDKIVEDVISKQKKIKKRKFVRAGLWGGAVLFCVMGILYQIKPDWFGFLFKSREGVVSVDSVNNVSVAETKQFVDDTEMALDMSISSQDGKQNYMQSTESEIEGVVVDKDVFDILINKQRKEYGMTELVKKIQCDNIAKDLAESINVDKPSNLQEYCSQKINEIQKKYSMDGVYYMLAYESIWIDEKNVLEHLVEYKSNSEAVKKEGYKSFGSTIYDCGNGYRYWVVILSNIE